MRIVVASDHAGFSYKSLLVDKLTQDGYAVDDLGTDGKAPADDYPDHAENVARYLLEEKADKGIIICGSGVGVSIAANKFKGIRAGVCHDTYSAHQSVEHDNMNVLCIGERVIGIALLFEIADAFIEAEFSNEPRHVQRLSKIEAIEEKNMKDERV